MTDGASNVQVYSANSLAPYPAGNRAAAPTFHQATRAGMTGYNMYSLVHLSDNTRQPGTPVAMVRWMLCAPCMPDVDATLLAVLGPSITMENPVDTGMVRAIATGQWPTTDTMGVLYREHRPVHVWYYPGKNWESLDLADALHRMMDVSKGLAFG